MKKLFERAAAATAVIFFAGAALAEDLAFDLFNNTSMTLMEFYTSPVDTADWGPDLLGSEVVESGGGGTVYIADGATICEYDMQFVFDDGSSLTDTVNVCNLASYTLTQ